MNKWFIEQPDGTGGIEKKPLITKEEIKEFFYKYIEFRQNKNYEKADELRNKFNEIGYKISVNKKKDFDEYELSGWAWYLGNIWLKEIKEYK